jgi:hypothetical protein
LRPHNWSYTSPSVRAGRCAGHRPKSKSKPPAGRCAAQPRHATLPP